MAKLKKLRLKYLDRQISDKEDTVISQISHNLSIPYLVAKDRYFSQTLENGV